MRLKESKFIPEPYATHFSSWTHTLQLYWGDHILGSSNSCDSYFVGPALGYNCITDLAFLCRIYTYLYDLFVIQVHLQYNCSHFYLQGIAWNAKGILFISNKPITVRFATVDGQMLQNKQLHRILNKCLSQYLKYYCFLFHWINLTNTVGKYWVRENSEWLVGVWFR